MGVGGGEGVVSISPLRAVAFGAGPGCCKVLWPFFFVVSCCDGSWRHRALVPSPPRWGRTSSPGICQSKRESVQPPSLSKLSSKCFVSSPRCRCKFSPLFFNHGGFSEVHPFRFLMCSTLLFSADTFVNNSFLHLPPSFNLDYFLVSWLFLIEGFRSPSKAQPLFADRYSRLWMEINCMSHTSVSNLLCLNNLYGLEAFQWLRRFLAMQAGNEGVYAITVFANCIAIRILAFKIKITNGGGNMYWCTSSNVCFLILKFGP